MLLFVILSALSSGAELRVEPGGRLILANAKLHNDCGEKWQGIVIVEKGDKKGKVTHRREAIIEDVVSLQD